MKKTLVGCLALGLVALVGLTPVHGQDPDYVLTAVGGQGAVGSQLVVPVLLDNAMNVAGISFGLCHDPAVVSVNCTGGIPNDCVDNGIIVQGAQLLATNGGSGASFFAPATAMAPTVGFTCGIVVNLLGADSLPAGTDNEVVVATYGLDAEGNSALTFCETGQPLVLLSVGIAGGGDVVPTVEDGRIDSIVIPNYTLVQGSGMAAVDGSGVIATTLRWNEMDSPAVAGISYGVCHDPAIADVACTGGIPNDCIDNGIIVQGAELQATNGGSGAGFFAPATATDPLVGYTCGIVVNLLGADVLPNTGTATIVETSYTGVAEGTSDLTVCETGNPLVLLSVGVAGGGDETPLVENGQLSVVGIVPFVRGDCNNDAKNDIADGIWTLNELFQGGPSGTCAAACDANDDGMMDSSDAIFTFTYQLLDGPPPPAPFPDCGTEDGQSPDDCAAAPCP